MSQVLLGIPAAIIIAAVSSWITVQLSLRRFRKERWWERKVGAYTNVIEALHNSREFADQHLDAEIGARELSEEREAELREFSNQADREIRKAANTGAFFLSDQAATRLTQFQKEEERAKDAIDWFTYLEADRDAVNSCLQDIIRIAKTELSLESSSRFRIFRPRG